MANTRWTQSTSKNKTKWSTFLFTNSLVISWFLRVEITCRIYGRTNTWYFLTILLFTQSVIRKTMIEKFDCQHHYIGSDNNIVSLYFNDVYIYKSGNVLAVATSWPLYFELSWHSMP